MPQPTTESFQRKFQKECNVEIVDLNTSGIEYYTRNICGLPCGCGYRVRVRIWISVLAYPNLNPNCYLSRCTHPNRLKAPEETCLKLTKATLRGRSCRIRFSPIASIWHENHSCGNIFLFQFFSRFWFWAIRIWEALHVQHFDHKFSMRELPINFS